MDKQEYKLKAEEIKSLIAKKDFFKAVEIADEIDWTKVRSVAMLCTVSDLYKVNRRYKESKELLLMAYERHPGGRMIVYSLCELCIKMGEVVQAVEYYKEFVHMAPMDNGRYILQYKLYVAQDVSLEERIAVLEELKKRDYREKWGYELAYLYHRIGLSTKCVEECDELILWFSEGRYVKKAMELKMLHQPLTEAQQASYDAFEGKGAELPKKEKQEEKIETSAGKQEEELDIHVQPVNLGQYDTINLQKALAESMKEVLAADEPDSMGTGLASGESQEPGTVNKKDGMGDVTRQIVAPMLEETDGMKEVFFEDRTGELSTDADADIAEAIPAMAVQPLENGEPQDDAGEDTDANDSAIAEAIGSATEEAIDSVTADEDDSASEETDINVSATADEDVSVPEETDINTSATTDENTSAIEEAMDNTDGEEPDTEEEETQVQFTGRDIPPELVPQDITKEIPSIKDVMKRPLVQAVEIAPSVPPKEVIPQAEELPREMASLLAQEYDGQISMVMPEEHQVEKQITGQMNIEDVLIEWEKTKKEYEEKRKAELTRKVKDQTGAMFTDFDEKIRDGVLEQLEKEAGIQKENDSLDRLNQLKQEDGTLPEFIILEEPAEEGTEEISAEDSPAVEASPEGDIEVPAEELMAEETAEEFAAEMEEIFPKDSGGSDAGGALEDSTDHLDEQEKEIHTSEAAEASQEEAEDFGEEIDTEAENREEREDVRDLTEEERALFAPFIQTKGARRRFLKALDSISLAAYTGNVIVTGEADAETVKLAKNIMKDVQDTDPNFSGVIAKVSGASLNSKSIDSTISKLNNGGLIIEKASGMNSQAVMKLLKALNQEQTGILVILEDNKKSMKRMLAAYPSLENFFNARIEIEELNNSALTAYGKQYAEVKEYAIDELGMLALQTRIEDRQTSEHIVTVSEVRELVDEAIENANRKNLTHFFELLLGKRYDGEDMIILRERDFIEK